MTDTAASGVKRRDFLKVIGATTATTTMIGCSSERVEKLIPYLVSPDETVPGVSTHYATTCRECSAGCGVIAETRDGRTIKLEGNPEHPLNRGALCARGQSALQGLYNPDRYRGPMVRRGNALVRVTWEEALQLFATRLGEIRSRGGAAGAVFLNQHETGSFPGFLDAWLAGYGMPAHLSYDAGADHAVVAANRQTYGVAWPRLDFRAARLIVSFGADFLDTWGAVVPQQLDFADARADAERAPRFVYVGPRRSLTGLNADQWIDCRPGSEITIARLLAGQITADQAAAASGVSASILAAFAAEFSSVTPSMVLAGGGGAGGLELALAANALNQARGSGAHECGRRSAAHGARRQSGVHASESGRVQGGDGEGAIQGQLLELPRRNFRAGRSHSSRSSSARAVGRRAAGARNTLAAAADDGSGVRHAGDIRCADRGREERSRCGRAVSASRLSQLADQPLSGRGRRAHRGAAARARSRNDRWLGRASAGAGGADGAARRPIRRQHVPRRVSAPTDR